MRLYAVIDCDGQEQWIERKIIPRILLNRVQYSWSEQLWKESCGWEITSLNIKEDACAGGLGSVDNDMR